MIDEVFGSVVVVVVEVLVDIGVEVVSSLVLSLRNEPPRIGTPADADTMTTAVPTSALLGYGVAGAVLGAVSLLLWPNHVAQSLAIRAVVIVLATLSGGGVMAAFGAWRARRQRYAPRLATFGAGAIFALMFAAARAVGHVWL